MAGGQPAAVVLKHLRTLFGTGTAAGLADGPLLERFLARGDEADFEALLARHGPMVLGVCRRMLGDACDIEDAFQATFLILVRKAGSLRERERLGCWLYGVAYRVAIRARSNASRSCARERPASEDAAVEPTGEEDRRELMAVLDEEMIRLPEKYRAPVVLCLVERQSHEEASRQLGCPLGTVKSRLAAARQRLQRALTRRGLAPSAALLGAVLTAESASAAVPVALAEATARAALGVVAGGVISASVSTLVEGVRRMMFLSKLKIAAAVAAMASLALLVLPSLQAEDPPSSPAAQKAKVSNSPAPPDKPKKEPEPETFPVTVTGRALDPDGNPVKSASICLLSINMKTKWKVVAKTTTYHVGDYLFKDVRLPVDRSESPQARTPYGGFQVFGVAPGFGVGWYHQQRIYAVDDIDPDDIQGLPHFGEVVHTDLTFRPASELKGRIVDEKGQPIERVKLEIHDADPMDEKGIETHMLLNGEWADFIPGGIGATETDRDGRFRLQGLPAETCFWVYLKRPEPGVSLKALYAATTNGPRTVHDGLSATGKFGGRMRHEVETGDMTLVFPSDRRMLVRAVYDDTGEPVPNLRLQALGEDGATGLTAWGETDAEGKVTLALPPGDYRALHADPPLESSYVRSYLRPFIVADKPDEQKVEFRLRRGSELLLEAVDANTGKGIPDVFFWIAPADEPEGWRYLEASTFQGHHTTADKDGKVRAVLDLPREPGKTYRIKAAGIRGKDPEQPRGWVAPALLGGVYEPLKAESDPVELPVGKTVKLRFELRKQAAEGDGTAASARTAPES